MAPSHQSIHQQAASSTTAPPTNSIRPPHIQRGNDIVIITVGPPLDKCKPFAFHKNLICAVSPFFSTAFCGGPFCESRTGRLDLPDEDPVVFQALYDWLYEDQVVAPADNVLADDLFWLQVLRLGDRRIVPGLQVLAFEALSRMFAAKIDGAGAGSGPPSRGFTDALFPTHRRRRGEGEEGSGQRLEEEEEENEEEDACTLAMQAWIVEHILFALDHQKRNNNTAMKNVEVLLGENTPFAAAIGRAMFGRKLRNSTINKHPAAKRNFTKQFGLDIEALRAQATAGNGMELSRSASARMTTDEDTIVVDTGMTDPEEEEVEDEEDDTLPWPLTPSNQSLPPLRFMAPLTPTSRSSRFDSPWS